MPYDVRLLSGEEDGLWDAFVAAHPLGHGTFMTPARRLWTANGWSFAALGALDKGQLAAGMLVSAKGVRGVPWRLVRVLAVLPCSHDVEGTSVALARAAYEWARSQKALEVEVRCRVPDMFEVEGISFHQGVDKAFCQLNYTDSGFFRQTYVVHIDRNDEELLASFEKECRREVRVGIKRGVTVEFSESAADFQAMVDADRAKASRKQLTAFTREVYEGFRYLFSHQCAKLFVARFDGQICNLTLVQHLGISQPLLLATTDHAYRKGVPPTGELLQYEVMKWMRNHGRKLHDMGGTPGPIPQKGHPNYTVWRFKRQFRGDYVKMVTYRRKALSRVGKVVMAVARRLGKIEN